MGSYMFRDLRADEIECRVKIVKSTGVSILLYKDARCDQNILDETVGAMNWERRHSRDNANCTVAIWDGEKRMWISKEDTGTESNTEAEKGLASDSFKRACFNWGIGRELYTAPFIWVKAGDCNIKDGKCNDKFDVTDIQIANKRIVALTIKNLDTGRNCFVWQDGKADAMYGRDSGDAESKKAVAFTKKRMFEMAGGDENRVRKFAEALYASKGMTVKFGDMTLDQLNAVKVQLARKLGQGND